MTIPPTAPKITANGAVHAGQPGVNAANTPLLIAATPNSTTDTVITFFI